MYDTVHAYPASISIIMTKRLVTIKGTDIEIKIYSNRCISNNIKYRGEKMNELGGAYFLKS